jgi:Family of unknown function (DUF6345)
MGDFDMSDPTFIPGIASIAPISGIGPISPIAAIPPTLTPGLSKVPPIEVASYWINHYKRCGQPQTDYCGSEADGFAGAMHSHGHKVTVIRREQDASPRQWDARTDQGPGGVDTVEFAYLATHGETDGIDFTKDGIYQWLHWFWFTFDSPDGCSLGTVKLQLIGKTLHPPDVKKPETVMRLGDGRLRWVVLDCCMSLHIKDVNISSMIKYYHCEDQAKKVAEATPDRTWGRCFDGVHLLFGFTGLCSDGGWTSERGASFGRRVGKGEPLADSWLDEAHSSKEDDVPVALACGRSPDDAMRRLTSESLAAVAQQLRAPDIGGFAYIWRIK